MSNPHPWTIRFKPREWQRAALVRWRKDCSGIVSVITGGGKTAFAAMCMEYIHQSRPGIQHFIVVPSLGLLDQWFVALTDDLGVPESEIACFSSQEKHGTFRNVNLVVINTARVLFQSTKPENPVFLIIDECHRAGSEENAKALAIRTAATLGLSATPFRENDEGYERFIAPALGKIVFEYGYDQAYEEKVITPFELVNVHFEPAHNPKNLALTQPRYRKASVDAWRVPFAVRLAEEHLDERAIVFHESVPAANQIYKLLAERSKSVTIYHSAIGPGIRRSNLQLFKRGVFDILVCCRALDEGINVPDASVGIIAKSTRSVRQRIQRLGRILRRHPGKKVAHIYTLFHGKREEALLRREEQRLGHVADIRWVIGRHK